MAIKKFSPLLAENPLCGIGEHKDVLDLSTGGVTRRIKKLVLDGTEKWQIEGGKNGIYNAEGIIVNPHLSNYSYQIASHFQLANDYTTLYYNSGYFSIINTRLAISYLSLQTVDAFKSYLAAQYTAGTPVTVWYVLATPETETITVPSGLTGTIEGYLAQSGTPTPSTPIYPEANPALVWAPTTYRKYDTETDTITSLPVQIIGDGQPITSCQISGNTVQDGTPTPDNPVDVVGCGVRTGNLWSNRGFSAATITSNHTHNISNGYGTTLSTTEGDEVTITQSAYPTGTVDYQNGFFMIDVDFSKYAVGDVVTISFDYIVNEIHALSTQMATTVYAGKNNNATQVTLSSGDWKISGRLTAVITIIAGMNPYVEVRLCGNSITVKNVMLNAGSTALPYEPYGYKLPPTVNGTEYPIYLGQVPTTRRIKKLVLTGGEVWTQSQTRIGSMYSRLEDDTISGFGFCDRAVNARSIDEFSSSDQIFIEMVTERSFINIWLFDTAISVTNFKAYLAAQYAAGTPVTVWYVLAEPETGVVNEPLHKIGNYADTVAAENIPTTGTPENFDVGTTLKPSEVQLTYHGWHEYEDTKYTQGG